MAGEVPIETFRVGADLGQFWHGQHAICDLCYVIREMAELVTVAEIEGAREVVAPVARYTELFESATLSRIRGASVLLKAEHRQRTGSFKIRGAYNHIHALPASVSHVVAASAGNHAQGVALAATLTGRKATIFMPANASLPKIRATEDYGAAVRLGGENVDECIAAAADFASGGGAAVVPPFDDRAVIAGQGTIGLEIAEAAPEVASILVPVGGGGLVSGIAAACAARLRRARVIGVEASGAAAMQLSLEAGRPVPARSLQTIADGIAVKQPSELTLAHVEAHVEAVVTVTDEEITRALLLLLEREKQLVEPAGAAGVAALLAGVVPGDGVVLAVLSGGNADPLVLTRLIEHGLISAGRFARFRILVRDKPGQLSTAARIIADLGLNVIDVDHHRTSSDLALEEVELYMTCECRGADQRDEALAALADAGFEVDVVN